MMITLRARASSDKKEAWGGFYDCDNVLFPDLGIGYVEEVHTLEIYQAVHI